MNVLLISQCDKRALTESRRILDQFAERRGDRTWQTAITQDGLDTLRKLLRKTARKNTAVACHWIRGRDHSELLWIVGDGKRFNAEGAVPTNTTQRNVLRRGDENDWHSLSLIQLLTRLAALLHDLGKACAAFQERLKKPTLERNEYRHEWISLRLFQAFVGDAADDATWLQRLITPTADDDASWFPDRPKLRDGLDDEARTQLPFSTLPPLAKAVGWLVLTHHRLPVMPASDERGDAPAKLGAKVRGFRTAILNDVLARVACDWNETPTNRDRSSISPYWNFGPHGLPVTTARWRERASGIAQRLLEHCAQGDARAVIGDPFVMHVARMSLMLADHHYSRLTDERDRVRGEKNYPLLANTRRDTGGPNQPLDEHLLGVEKHARSIVHALPSFDRHLSRLVRHRFLRQRSNKDAFRWQDRAVDMAAGLRERARQQGAFIVNLASTGCGKTLANARIMNALADPVSGMRCAFAMGLRTLTLQTGRVFQSVLQLGDDELAIMVGGAASRELFEFHEKQAERTGSASSHDLLPEVGTHVLYEGNEDHPLLQRLSPEPRVRRMLAAPVLVCTVDHLTPATESQRGGHQIAPMLRLLSGDLVLDEPDDFGLDDLPALTRLVHWAGLLGSRVLLSSATLPPALVEGLFLAYREGRRWFQRNRGQRPDAPPDICCLWVDEFARAARDCADAVTFRAQHLAFAAARNEELLARARKEPRRRAELLPMPITEKGEPGIRSAFARLARDAALRLHADHHDTDPRSGKRVSFGLIRMANIRPLFDVALALYRLGAPEGVRIHLCVYHSQFPLLIRSAIERRLDAALDRRTADAVFALPDVRACLDTHSEADHLFVVLGSPVTEVGRDHDYDWAVVEPSSMRSIIQLVGRVRRHRGGAASTANVLICEHNLKRFEQPGEPSFRRPGFESEDHRLERKSLQSLLRAEEYVTPDSRPRLLARETLTPTSSLVDLEHARLMAEMLPQATRTPTAKELRIGAPPDPPPLNATAFLSHPQVWLTAILSQQQPFRRSDSRPEAEVVLLPSEGGDDYVLTRINRDGRKVDYATLRDGVDLHRIDDAQVRGERIAPWGISDYLELLEDYATSMALPMSDCAKRYGVVSIPECTYGWRFHPTLGFVTQE